MEQNALAESMLYNGNATPRSARCSRKVLGTMFLVVGLGFAALLILAPGSPAGEPAINMALTNLKTAGAGVLPRLRSAWPVSARAPVQPAMPQQSMPPAVAGYWIKPDFVEGQGGQGQRSVMARATGSAEGGDPVITILGATGLVGQELLELIPRAYPNAKLQLFASSKKTMECHGKTWQIEAASDLEGPNAPKGDLAMVALDDAFSAKYVPILLELGYYVVDKSNTYRMDPKVPLVVGGVNSDLVTDDVKLVANPNCNTIPFCLAVAPLQRKYGLKAATVSSYQAISGAGVGTLDDFLGKCAAGYSAAESTRIGTQFDKMGYAGNVFPHNGNTDESGFSSEERKLIFESQKILRQEYDVNAQCCRVPVAVGHYENAWVTFGEKVTPEMAEAVLTDKSQAPFVQYKPGASGDGMTTLVGLETRDDTVAGRVRPDPRDKTEATLCMTVLADNLRQGAATNAMRVASCWFKSKDENLQAKCFPPK
jgi:aspartate-semialdehyde dehydrogenase